MEDFFGGEFGVFNFGENITIVIPMVNSIVRSIAELTINSKLIGELSVGAGSSLEVSIIKSSGDLTIRVKDYAEL